MGRRDVPTRTIVREFFLAPSRDFLVNTRFDYVPDDRDRLSFRYTFEDLKDTNSSQLDRSIGSASYHAGAEEPIPFLYGRLVARH